MHIFFTNKNWRTSYSICVLKGNQIPCFSACRAKFFQTAEEHFSEFVSGSVFFSLSCVAVTGGL
jgi:hypothetical protein